MATLKEIKTRITSVQNTQKITKAMKMVASAKLRRAQDRIMAARPYAEKINELLTHLIDASSDIINPLMEGREIKNKLVVVITADRGLAGSFNSNLLKFAEQYLDSIGKDTKVIAVGKKANDFFKKKSYELLRGYSDVFSNLNVGFAQDTVREIVKGYLDHQYDKVDVIYNKFESVARQVPVREQFLPLGSEEDKAGGDSDEGNAGSEVKDVPTVKADYIYEPSVEGILNDLIPRQLNTHFWKSLLESNAAEQGARMTAMEMATKNAGDLIQHLKLQYNRARQEAITTEILEIVGGAEALKDG